MTALLASLRGLDAEGRARAILRHLRLDGLDAEPARLVRAPPGSSAANTSMGATVPTRHGPLARLLNRLLLAMRPDRGPSIPIRRSAGAAGFLRPAAWITACRSILPAGDDSRPAASTPA